MVEKANPKFFYGYIVALAAFFGMVVMWGTIYSFGVFFKPLSTEFGWTSATTSGAYSLFMVLHSLLYPFTGRLTDRFGPRIVLSVCGLLLGLGYILMSQISALWHLYLFYGVIISIGMSGGSVPFMSTIPRWFVRRRGLMTGIVLSGAGLGTMTMPPLANWLISSYDWHVAYMVVAIITWVVVLFAAQFLKHDPSEVGQLPYGAGEAKVESLKVEVGGFSLREVIGTKQFWLLCGSMVCLIFSEQTAMVHIVNYAIGTGISAARAAGILTIIGGLTVAGRVILGGSGDRIGNKRSLVICCSLVAIAFAWLLVARGAWMFYLFAAVLGFGYGGQAATTAPLLAELFGLRCLGTILGTTALVGMTGGASGPLLTGYIFDVTKSYDLALLICAVLCVIGLALVLLVTPLGVKKKS